MLQVDNRISVQAGVKINQFKKMFNNNIIRINNNLNNLNNNNNNHNNSNSNNKIKPIKEISQVSVQVGEMKKHQSKKMYY